MPLEQISIRFDLERGITTHHESEAMLNRKMAEVAREVIAVTDSSKFGCVCLHRIIGLNEITALVTDAGHRTILAGPRTG